MGPSSPEGSTVGPSVLSLQPKILLPIYFSNTTTPPPPPPSHDSTILDQEDPLFNHATSLGRFFTLNYLNFMSQQPIAALNPSFNPNTIQTSITIDNDHEVCAHNLAHNLAHNPFVNLVVTSIVSSKGELTSPFSFSTVRAACCLDESTLLLSNDPFTCYIKPPLYSGTPLKTAFWSHFWNIFVSLPHRCSW